MFSTCMFCNRPLGSNQVIEELPVGRRLAFDAERGRLWVVCRKCDRWNLSPIEERWEAVETCERLFRATRVRVSTENVGLARHPEGLELVRIGRPMRPEFAAWRYGDQFGRRRKRALIYGSAGAVVIGGLYMSAQMMSGGFGGLMVARILWRGRPRVKLRTDDGRVIRLNDRDLLGTRLRADPNEPGFRLEVRRNRSTEWFAGGEAERLAGQIIPKLNRMGGKEQTVQMAVSEIERYGHPNQFLEELVAHDRFQDRRGVPGYVNKMPAPTKLALEMALHEEQERRALEGELWRLERAWQEAEEIAAISDSLLLPPQAGEFIKQHGTGSKTETQG